MAHLQHPEQAGPPRRGVRSVLVLGGALAAFGLAVGLSAIPEFAARNDRDVRYERTFLALQHDLQGLREEQALLLKEIEDRTSRLESLRAVVEGRPAGDNLDTRLQEFRQDLEARFAEATAERPAPSAHRLRNELREEVLNPVFQLTGRDAVGSAVLVHLQEDPGQRYYLAVTCYHVVRDILEERGRVRDVFAEPLETRFDRDGVEQSLEGRMVAFDDDLDLALLRIDTAQDLGTIARIAPLAREDEVEVFSPVYTVGCPLGTVAQATRGQVTHRHWEIENKSYWMVSTPAYFGNSGGGVFMEETRELVGVFAKIYTHGTYRPQVITHMGLVIPLSVLHSWLQQAGFGHILPQTGVSAARRPG